MEGLIIEKESEIMAIIGVCQLNARHVGLASIYGAISLHSYFLKLHIVLFFSTRVGYTVIILICSVI
jgi:hypothetical protein